MKILALELSTRQGSVAWLSDSKQDWVQEFSNDRKHSGLFFETLEHCLNEFGHPDAIVVGLGPGSYAGIRIAIATAIGLRAALPTKLIGIASACAIETDAPQYCVVGDARRQSFFLGRISNNRLLDEPSLHSITELKAIISEVSEAVFCSEVLPDFPTAELAYPSARLLAKVASEQIFEMPDSQSLEPIYLRGPHITIPKNAVTKGME